MEASNYSFNDLTSDLARKGLNQIFSKFDPKGNPFQEELIRDHMDLIQLFLLKIEPSIQIKIIELMFKYNPTVFSESFWISYIDEALAKFSDAATDYVHKNGAMFVLLNRIIDSRKEVDWFEVLTKLSNATATMGTQAPGFETVLEWLITADKANLKKLLYRTETKQYPTYLKESLYKSAIGMGLLDIKLARRLRSDSSGAFSNKMLEYLFSRKNAYSDKDFQELIVQFCDTKHKWVARLAAINMPIHLAPYLMGLDDKFAMQILEQRLNAKEERDGK